MVHDLTTFNSLWTAIWDSSVGRNDVPVNDRNPAVSFLMVNQGYGRATSAGNAIVLEPPNLVRLVRLFSRTVDRISSARYLTRAIDRGRITGYFALPQLGDHDELAATIEVPAGSPAGGLIFRVGTRSIVAGAIDETVLFERTMKVGEPAQAIRVGLGALAPPAAVFLEVEAVASGIGERGLWHRAQVGAPAELDRFNGQLDSTLHVLRTDAAQAARATPDPSPVKHWVVPVYDDEPDQPYELTVTYAVDGRGVSDNLTASPRRPAQLVDVRTFGYERDLGLAPSDHGQHPVSTLLGARWFQFPGDTVSGGWTGGLQPGQAVHLPSAMFSLEEMAGDGDSGASWVGVVKVALEDDPTAVPGNALPLVRDALVSALQAELEAALPVAGTRTGLTVAEARAIVAKMDSIAHSVVSAVLSPLLGAQPQGDDLVGVVHEAFLLEELRLGPVTRVAVVSGPENCSYRITTTAS